MFKNILSDAGAAMVVAIGPIAHLDLWKDIVLFALGGIYMLYRVLTARVSYKIKKIELKEKQQELDDSINDDMGVG
jgi:hypothetical protein